MSDYPMLISNKLHSFRNFTGQRYNFFSCTPNFRPQNHQAFANHARFFTFSLVPCFKNLSAKSLHILLHSQNRYISVMTFFRN